MAQNGTRTARAKTRFIAELERTGMVSEAARAAEVPRRTVYNWRESDEEFRAAWDEIVDRATDILEAAVYRRATSGVERPIYQGGQLVGTVREYSDSLAMFILRSRRPEVYRDHHTVKHEGGGKDGAIQIDVPPAVSEAAHEFLARIRDAGS